MKSLSQYINLYAECRRQLDLVPKPIAALRPKALDALRVFSEQTMSARHTQRRQSTGCLSPTTD